MTNYHVNPNTGKPNSCLFKFICKIKNGNIEHYPTQQEAQTKYETAQTLARFFKNREIIPMSLTDNLMTNENYPTMPAPAYSSYSYKLVSDKAISEYDDKFSMVQASSINMMNVFEYPEIIEIFKDRQIKHTIELEDGDGRVCSLVDGISEDLDTYYSFGDLTQDSDLLRRLIEEDPDFSLINDYCVDFASELLVSCSDYVDTIAEIYEKDGELIHTIVKLKDGSYLDGLGHWSPSGLLELWDSFSNPDDVYEIRIPNEELKRSSTSTNQHASAKVLRQYLEKVYVKA